MGNTIVLCGPPHSGKTTILCHIFKTALELNIDVITTTKIFNPPPGLTVVNCASNLLKTYALSSRNVLMAFDDAQADFDSTAMASTKQSRINQKLYLYIAKLQGNLVFVAHYFEKIPRPIFDTGPLRIWAIEPGLMEIQATDFKVPPSPYDFPKAFIPSWEWDVDMSKLNHELSKVKGRNNNEIIARNKQIILDFLEDNNGYSFTKKDEILVLLKTLEPYFGKEKKINQKLIADAVGVDPGYITRIKHTH